MKIDCYQGPGRGGFSFVCQLEALSLEIALLMLAKQLKFRMTHMRVRPTHRIGFHVGKAWFLIVMARGESGEFMRRQRGDRDYSHW